MNSSIITPPQSKLNKATTNRLDALLILRGFACLLVVIHHCNPYRNSIIYRDSDLSWLIFSPDGMAVWIFFVLSGYLMGKAFFHERYTADVPGVLNFWRNRAIRIFPLYYFAVLILTIFVYPDWLKIENWGYLLRVCTFTYAHSIQIKSGLSFNAAFWSLSTEIQFYLIVPFAYNYFKNRLFNKEQVFWSGLGIISLTFVIRCIFWMIFREEIADEVLYTIKYWYTPLITNLDLFFTGFLVNGWLKYQSNHRKANLNSGSKYLAITLIILLYLFSAYHLYHQELVGATEHIGKGFKTSTSLFVLPLLTALVTSFFIFAFESDNYHHSQKNEKLSFASTLRNPLRIFEIFGNLSYGVYIWHMPIIEKIYPVFTSTIPFEAFYARFTATLIVSTLLATVTYYLVELPADKWKIYRSSPK